MRARAAGLASGGGGTAKEGRRLGLGFLPNSLFFSFLSLSSLSPSLPPSPPPQLVADGQKERERIYEQIEYDYLVTPNNQDQVDELVEIMLAVFSAVLQTECLLCLT